MAGKNDNPEGAGNPAPSGESKKPDAPETFTRAEVEALLAKTRKEEKDKLYGRLESLEKTAKELESERKARAEAEAQAKKLAEADAEAKRKAEEEKLGVNERLAAFEKRLADQLKAKDEEIAAARAAAQEAVKVVEERLAKAQIAAAKTDAISRYKIKHLSALVSGDTVEAIEESAKAVAEQEKRIFEEARAEVARDAVPGGAAPPVGDGSGGPPTRFASTIEQRVAAVKSGDGKSVNNLRQAALEKARAAMRNYPAG